MIFVRPKAVTIDKSGANLAALDAVNAERETPIKIPSCKYPLNIVEQDRRAAPSSDEHDRC